MIHRLEPFTEGCDNFLRRLGFAIEITRVPKERRRLGHESSHESSERVVGFFLEVETAFGPAEATEYWLAREARWLSRLEKLRDGGKVGDVDDSFDLSILEERHPVIG